MVDFAKLKKSSTSFEDLTKKVEKLSEKTGGGYKKDERFWNCTQDKAGNGTATIRFLPTPDMDGDDGTPFVSVYSHGFKVNGNWYIENCPTTIGEQYCPVCTNNNFLWKSEVQANREYVSKVTKRKLSYISNIYVVNDPANPDNNGKVFLYKYNVPIFNKIKEAMNPPEKVDEDEEVREPFNPFDLWTGSNFKIIIEKKGENANFDKCKFLKCKPLLDDDDALELVYSQEYSLLPFVAKDQFKSEEELQKRFDYVHKTPTAAEVPANKAPRTVMDNDEDNEDDDQPVVQEPAKPVSKAKAASKKVVETIESDEDADYFKNLLSED